MNDGRSLWTRPPSAAEHWKRFEDLVRNEQQAFFEGNAPIAGARAPGRLDVMGGVADYSGSLVLEMPIAEAACAAWQWRDDRKIRIRSLSVEADEWRQDVSISLDDVIDPSGHVRSADEVHRRLTADPETRWAAYVVGCFYVMVDAYSKIAQGKVDIRLGEQGANILLKSEVPPGAGLSSSAAIEVATMHALSEAAGIHPSDMTLAAWCQRVENAIVGAPCGIMDQVACALGQEDALIVLRCQPHDLLGVQTIPPGWRFVGIDSRVKHAVGGTHYTKARIGAFMGLKVIQLESGGKLLENYLCKMSPAEFEEYKELIPDTLSGREYSERYGRLPDTVTRVEMDTIYHPRACAEHPILENYRVRQFAGLMQIAEMRGPERASTKDGTPFELTDEDRGFMDHAGQLMYEAHASYGERLDLGSPETDLLVELVRARGMEQGLYGAKITGGGAGGTVAVLAQSDSNAAENALAEVCREYAGRTGVAPRLFIGSSPGAVAFGARQILRG
jgi:galactokinase